MASPGRKDQKGIEDKDEFDEASVLSNVYCKQITEAEFHNQGISETERALNELMGYLDTHPDEFGEMLKKRKRQDLETGGMISYLKVKVMDVFYGSNSPLLQVSEKERENKLREMKKNMQKAFEYTVENKERRFSKCLQTKREKKEAIGMAESKKIKMSKKQAPATAVALPPVPPPPPPVPPLVPTEVPPTPPILPPVRTEMPPPLSLPSGKQKSAVKYEVTPRRPFEPLEERLNRQNNVPSSGTRQEDVNDSFGSMASLDCSLTSLHQELLSYNPCKQLKSVDENRSPGGTPSKAKKPAQPNTPREPLHLALMNKFRNVRSPSPQGLATTSQISADDTSFLNEFSP